MSEKTHAELIAEQLTNIESLGDELPAVIASGALRKLLRHLDEAHNREIGVLKQRCAELDAEVAAKDEVIKRLNDAIAEEQRRKMATPENSSAVGDVAKLREALKLCMDEMCNRCRDLASARGNPLPCLQGCEPVRKAKAALAEPPRNCEVGTAEEQYKRFIDMCVSRSCTLCPYKAYEGCGRDRCLCNWAQKPYKEGGKDADK